MALERYIFALTAVLAIYVPPPTRFSALIGNQRDNVDVILGIFEILFRRIPNHYSNFPKSIKNSTQLLSLVLWRLRRRGNKLHPKTAVLENEDSTGGCTETMTVGKKARKIDTADFRA